MRPRCRIHAKSHTIYSFRKFPLRYAVDVKLDSLIDAYCHTLTYMVSPTLSTCWSKASSSPVQRHASCLLTIRPRLGGAECCCLMRGCANGGQLHPVCVVKRGITLHAPLIRNSPSRVVELHLAFNPPFAMHDITRGTARVYDPCA